MLALAFPFSVVPSRISPIAPTTSVRAISIPVPVSVPLAVAMPIAVGFALPFPLASSIAMLALAWVSFSLSFAPVAGPVRIAAASSAAVAGSVTVSVALSFSIVARVWTAARHCLAGLVMCWVRW